MTLITFNITHSMLNSAKFIYTGLIVEFTWYLRNKMGLRLTSRTPRPATKVETIR